MDGLINFEDAIVADSSMVLPDDLELRHSPDDVLLLLEARLHHAGIDLFLKYELEVIVRIGLSVPDEVEMVEGTHESNPKLFELPVNPLLDAPQNHVQLNVVELVEVKDVDRVHMAWLLDRRL